jgi:hypothetical protein
MAKQSKRKFYLALQKQHPEVFTAMENLGKASRNAA